MISEDVVKQTEISSQTAKRLWLKTSILLIFHGILFSLIGLFRGGGWQGFGLCYLWGFAFVWTAVLGCLFFVALQHATSSVWSVVIRRVAEIWASPMLLVAVFFVGLIGLAIIENVGLYPWAHPEHNEELHLTGNKELYLNLGFFVVRGILFFALWVLFTRFFVGKSLVQDHADQPLEIADKLERVSRPFLGIFAFSATFASFDWLMSLDPMWFSTIYGVYVFAGMFVTALSVITLTVIGLRNANRLGEGIIRNEHLYNLGGLLLGFVCFWGYIAFSQYMLIWYGNIPEETEYFITRFSGGWLTITVLLAITRFAIPFLVLLPRDTRMNPRILTPIAILMIAGQILDLYWLIMPHYHPEGPVGGFWQFGPLLLMSGIILLWGSRFIANHNTMAANDPLFEKSKQFRL
jgi:hypothetical protein